MKVAIAILVQAGLKSNPIEPHILVTHIGTVGRLTPCSIRVEGAWESGKGWEHGAPC